MRRFSASIRVKFFVREVLRRNVFYYLLVRKCMYGAYVSILLLIETDKKRGKGGWGKDRGPPPLCVFNLIKSSLLLSLEWRNAEVLSRQQLKYGGK